ncbi:hypothetical protein CS063_09490 [Sporanaerobium hydrogeniformans]|uniref:Uncharacterized protein n=1 Tax=Sporanaerobium hydrogeniformans TaxID=3072179 RepID=A0AC61DCP7_9FIRM|nr:hypothetical protein [Sporanaerobium hydrogeniformans]PHV70526.1 hypothetical protein CS063_09490 [Sporanaerobium hydrogeniformans]
MLKRRIVFFLIVGITLGIMGCNKTDENIYQLKIGNPFNKAIKIEVISYGTNLQVDKNTLSQVDLELKFTNIGAQPIDTEKDLEIEIIQGSRVIAPIKNTLLETNKIEPQRVVEGELVIEIDSEQEEEIKVTYKLDGATKSFKVITEPPASIK